ncbi:Upstream activation factor subunit spp27 [Armadillidium nasatum]|uniref:Upstream activation factor subunit spp27 n=1 Tax=Armadillidium nasatum TaxID=96803 RepID=A0A5N5SLH1_9CRUS|nr:Upstream activation factor subunit spp27 [Armadillidium nasatum]
MTFTAIVAEGDLKSLTSRKVRKLLERVFQLDLTSRKKEIDNILMAEVDDHANSHSEEDEVSEEEVHSSRKKADSDSDAEIEDGDEKDDDDEYQPSKGGRKPKPGKKRKGQDDDDDSDDDWNKKKPAKKGPAAGGRGGGGKKQSAFTKSFKLSPELADVVGSDVMPRHEVVKKLWAVIKERDLQDPKNKQYAICDDQLMKVFGIKRFRTFGMMKHLKDHFLEAA